MDASSRRNRITELIDPACVADTFCEGIGEIEQIGAACVRVTLFASRAIADGVREHIVVARLVLALETFSRGIRQCEAFSSGAPLLIDDRPPDGRAN
ncbi:hypothetical protein [Mesorhizobium sp.]|uniref:hypothetical protein n=1 Tax=Mesorhizobium sp. TaxID=1871066 RepID=UPI0025DA6B7E|nr:hypothetical protein [Mesorhizobium sp.]